MTLKQVCFSLFFLIVLTGCSPVKTKQLYSGFNQEGMHSRALYHFDQGFVVGGKNGVVSVFNDNYEQITDSLKGSEDLRDVHVFSDGSMLFINSGEKGMIWKVSKNLKSKYLTYNRANVFLDGVDFWDDRNGVAYGDPVNGKFVVLVTRDAGETWFPISYNILPYALPNEGGFAASGTGIATLGENTVYIGTGIADTARVYCSYDRGLNWKIKNTPLKTGDSYGVYSMYFWSEDEGVVVGGSYKNPDDKEKLCFYTQDACDSWTDVSEGLGGYTSCVHGNKDGSFLVATGRVATYFSLNKGKSWSLLLNETFYSVRVGESKLYFSGKNGKVAVYSYKIKS